MPRVFVHYRKPIKLAQVVSMASCLALYGGARDSNAFLIHANERSWGGLRCPSRCDTSIRPMRESWNAISLLGGHNSGNSDDVKKLPEPLDLRKVTEDISG